MKVKVRSRRRFLGALLAAPLLVNNDPPTHPHYREFFGAPLTRERIAALRPATTAGVSVVLASFSLVLIGYVSADAMAGAVTAPRVLSHLPVLIGAILAAIAGIMYASNYGTAQHTMGFLPGLKAFTAAVFGGIGNLAGAVVGGILLGLIEAIGSGYIGVLTGGVLGSHYSDIFAFIVLIVMLTLRPSGLLGERVADRA